LATSTKKTSDQALQTTLSLLQDLSGSIQQYDFAVRDVESLRDHYMLTLRHWVHRLEAHAEEARKLTNDVTYRVWRLYMSGPAHGFQTGFNNTYQTLLTKPDRGDSGLPLTRADWYR